LCPPAVALRALHWQNGLMAEIFPQAKAYFESAASDPWRWAEGGKVLVWADGSTVAFRDELVEILDGLASNGLPPFRLVVLILAACKGKMPPTSQSEGRDTATAPWNDPANQEFSELLARLRQLHQLPAEHRENPRVKAILMETILEGVNVPRSQPARELVQALSDFSLPIAWEEGQGEGRSDLNTSEYRAKSDEPYRILHAALAKFSPASFALRLRTGLDALPQPAEVELRPSERARQLLAVLRSDPEQQGLAKVARDIMAALYLPRSLSELDELALGGFSDISNRGSLDRLLPSELANDDLTLASRIALNEALYIRREPPSNHPPARLAMLLDSGVRQWGLPRVFATAVALAFIAKEERCTDVNIWRATRNSLAKTDLLSQKGLIEHLGALETYAHPGGVLKSFFAHFDQQPEMEAVLVTHRDCLADPDFQKCLAEIDWKRFYIATVERDGSFEWFAHPHRQKPLCQAEIALEELFAVQKEIAAPAKAIAKLKDQRHDPSLPLVLKVKPFPFLLPILNRIEWSKQFQDGAGVAILSDRRLVHWDTPVKCTKTLVEKLPPGRTLWLGPTEGGKKVHVVKILTRTRMASLTTWDGDTGEVETTEFTFWKAIPEHVFERRGVLYIISNKDASAWSVNQAEFLGKIDLPQGYYFSHGTYFRCGNDWSFLSYDGTALRMLNMALPSKWKGLNILALFNREGSEACPFALTTDAKVYSSEGECVLNLGLVKRGDVVVYAKFSRDGHRILLKPLSESDFQLIDLWRGSSRRVSLKKGKNVYEIPLGLLEQVFKPCGYPVRTKFTHISIAPGEQLMLKSAKGFWYKICLEGKELRLVGIPKTEPEPPSAIRFEPVRIPAEFNFRLKVAIWPDGSRAWLDSRGLLHLKRGNSTNPEVCLVLAEGPMGAWSSDGKICGPDYFLHKPALADAATLMTRIELFCPIA